MDEIAIKILKDLREDFQYYAEKCLMIRSKSGHQTFKLNMAQKKIHEIVTNQKRAIGKVRAIILKGRQQGCSTYIEGRFYWLVTHIPGFRAFILTHDNDATNNLFEMALRFHENCPPVIRPKVEASNAKELIFSAIDSGYKLGTAGNKAVGRSSTIQLLHGSEVSFWPNATEHAKGILQAVPNLPGTEIFIESTANGVGNWFHEQWQLAVSGESEYAPIFIPWYWQEEYRMPLRDDFELTEEEMELKKLYGLDDLQINWRRYKMMENKAGGSDPLKAFMQEYPSNAIEAFQMSGDDYFIDPSIVMKARKIKCEDYGQLLIGVDPARFGSDRTSIIRRRTRRAYGLQSFQKKDTMQVTGIVHKIIMEEKPHRVFIDICGLGAGIYDRLLELGHKDILVSVNGGSTPLDQKKYLNKRAEMWDLMKACIIDQPFEIPDSDSLHSDLCNIKYDFDSKSRMHMEKKEDMKKRGVRSPDEGDALALTFALPTIALQESREKRYADIAKDMFLSSERMDRLRKEAFRT
jgi:hypothetical protein